MAAREVIQGQERKDDDAICIHEPREGAAGVFEEQERDCSNDRQKLRKLRVKPRRIRAQQEQ